MSLQGTLTHSAFFLSLALTMITSTQTVKKFKLLSKGRLCCPLSNQAANWNLIFVPHVLTGVQSAGWNENQQKKVQERKTFGLQMIWFEIVLYVSSFHLHLAMNKNSILGFFQRLCLFFCCRALSSRELGVDTATQSWNNHWCKCLDDWVLKFWGGRGP